MSKQKERRNYLVILGNSYYRGANWFEEGKWTQDGFSATRLTRKEAEKIVVELYRQNKRPVKLTFTKAYKMEQYRAAQVLFFNWALAVERAIREQLLDVWACETPSSVLAQINTHRHLSLTHDPQQAADYLIKINNY